MTLESASTVGIQTLLFTLLDTQLPNPVVIDVPHIYPFANWSIDGKGGMENVYNIHLSEYRVINIVCQQNKVCRQH